MLLRICRDIDLFVREHRIKSVEKVSIRDMIDYSFWRKPLAGQRERSRIDPLTYRNLLTGTIFMYLNKTFYSRITSRNTKFVAMFPVFAEDDSWISCSRCCLQYT